MSATRLIVWTERPLNAETPVEMLYQADRTPTELLFVRNHGRVPAVCVDGYRLRLGGEVSVSLVLSLTEIRERPRQVTVTATLACAGNRRHEFGGMAGTAGGVPWGAGAIGNARWTGARLRDVLRAVGIAPSARQVAFTGLDEVQPASGAEPFGAAIPVEKALTLEVLVAYEITGRQLPPEHEVALRIVAPGYIGARSVKRLSEIMVRSTPSSSFFQRDDYTRCGESLNELPPNCAICSRREGATVRGLVPVEGYVLAGGGRAVERVEVSPDGGVTWTEAALAGSPSSPWAWLIWRAIVELGAGSNEVVVRAWDSAAVGQPDDPASIWNPRGHLNKAGTG